MASAPSAEAAPRGADTVGVLNPSTVVLGGDIANAHENLLVHVRGIVYTRALPLTTRSLRIVPNELRERAGVVGGADRDRAPDRPERPRPRTRHRLNSGTPTTGLGGRQRTAPRLPDHTSPQSRGHDSPRPYSRVCVDGQLSPRLRSRSPDVTSGPPPVHNAGISVHVVDTAARDGGCRTSPRPRPDVVESFNPDATSPGGADVDLAPRRWGPCRVRDRVGVPSNAGDLCDSVPGRRRPPLRKDNRRGYFQASLDDKRVRRSRLLVHREGSRPERLASRERLAGTSQHATAVPRFRNPLLSGVLIRLSAQTTRATCKRCAPRPTLPLERAASRPPPPRRVGGGARETRERYASGVTGREVAKRLAGRADLRASRVAGRPRRRGAP
jgi:hypothetical protein